MFENVTEMGDFAPAVSPVISPALDFSPVLTLDLGSTFGDFAPSIAGIGGLV